MIAADDAVELLGVRDAVTDEEQEARESGQPEQDYSHAASHRWHWARLGHHELPTYLVPESDQISATHGGDRPPTGPRARPRAYPRNGEFGTTERRARSGKNCACQFA